MFDPGVFTLAGMRTALLESSKAALFVKSSSSSSYGVYGDTSPGVYVEA
jgi:hypothetical protein